MTAATFGDLLAPARAHFARAAGFPDSALRGECVIEAARATGRLAGTLSRYLADIAPYGMAEAITLRDPVNLAPDPAQFTAVVSAVHHAAGAVVSIAAADFRAVGVAIRASRLHVSTRTLPDGYDVPYRFAHALPSDTAALLDAYQAASAASDRAVTDLDALMVTVGAPSRILGLARAATRPALGASAIRRAGGPPAGPAGAAPGGSESAVSLPPGAAEMAVRRHGNPDLGLLLRARAIDKATRVLIAEAKGRARVAGTPGRAESNGRPAAAARVANEGFPAGPVTSRADREPGRPRPRGLPPMRPADVPGRVPSEGRRRQSS